MDSLKTFLEPKQSSAPVAPKPEFAAPPHQGIGNGFESDVLQKALAVAAMVQCDAATTARLALDFTNAVMAAYLASRTAQPRRSRFELRVAEKASAPGENQAPEA